MCALIVNHLVRAVGEISGPILKEQLSQLSFSEIHDESGVAVVGKVKYSLTQ